MRWLALVVALAPAAALAQGDPDAGPPPADDSVTAPPAAPPPTSAPERIALPPRRLVEYTLEGELRPVDTETIVRGLLDPVMPLGNLWSDDEQRAVADFCARIGYHVSIRSEPVGEAGTRAVLNLRPVTLVRHVDIAIDEEGFFLIRWGRGLLEDVIFEEDIKRHMRLRPGSPLPLDEATRNRVLEREHDRIFDFLKDEGFPEAKVRIAVAPDGAFAMRLVIRIDTGPAYKVGNVRVTGNTAVPAAEIRELFFHTRLYSLPRRFSRDRLKRDLDAVADLYKRRGFPGVRVSSDFGRGSFNRAAKTVDFTVIVRERRRIEVYFEGVSAVSELDLREQLTLDNEGSYDDFEVDRSAQAIRRFYQSKGHFEANVVWERASFRLPGQLFDRIVFTVDEGPRLKIKRVEFVGNEAISSVRLQDLIKTREFPRFGFLTSGGYTTSLQLEQDAARIRAAYRALGFADVRVEYEVARSAPLLGNAPALAASIVSDLPADGLFVRFRIDEGPRQLVSRVIIEFKGVHRKQPAELIGKLSLRRDAPYTAEAAEADGERIKRYYFQQGYPHAKVETAVRPACVDSYDPEQQVCVGGSLPDRIVITHRVKEGAFVRFGKVALRGNFKTRNWVLLEQLGIVEGAAFTLGAAETAQRNLRTSGLFSTVRFDYIGLEEDAPKDKVNVVVHVQERFDHWTEYQAGGGYASDDGWFVIGGLEFPNMLGIGMGIESTARVGLDADIYPDVGLSTTDSDVRGKLVLPPWIQKHYLKLSFRTELEGSWQIEQHERFGELDSRGVSVSLQREGKLGGPWEGWLLSLRYDFRRRNRAEDLVRPAGPSDDTDDTRVTTFTGSIGPVLVIDQRRDEQGRLNPLSPTRGYSLAFSALFADRALGGNDRFIKLGFKGQHYWQLGRRLLITNGVRYDHGIPMGGAVLLPEVERYFAGGDNTVRGFEEDRLLTELIMDTLPPIGGVPQFRVLPAGGNLRFIHNVDLQVTLWDDGPLFPWASAIFLDTGMIANSLDGVEPDDLRHSLGIAFLRMVSPFGAFSLEWAVPLDPTRGDNPRGRFHFNLGFVFK